MGHNPYIMDMSSEHQIRLASYNVRKCIGLDRRRRPMRIIDVINTLGADVIALQEADRRLGDRPAALPARMIEDETDYRSVEIDGGGRSVGWHGNAVLVKKGLGVTAINQVELPGTEPRGAVSVEIDGKFRVVGTHLGLLRSDRRAQLTTIRQHLGHTKYPAIILGDFNEWREHRGLEPLSDGFQVHSPGRSFHAARPVAALDRIALGAGLELRDGGVVENPVTRVASDHLPIWADISLGG